MSVVGHRMQPHTRESILFSSATSIPHAGWGPECGQGGAQDHDSNRGALPSLKLRFYGSNLKCRSGSKLANGNGHRGQPAQGGEAGRSGRDSWGWAVCGKMSAQTTVELPLNSTELLPLRMGSAMTDLTIFQKKVKIWILILEWQLED